MNFTTNRVICDKKKCNLMSIIDMYGALIRPGRFQTSNDSWVKERELSNFWVGTWTPISWVNLCDPNINDRYG